MRTSIMKSETVAEGTMAFYMTKPEGFAYHAGQNCDFTLINPPETDPEGNKRTFSIASAPSEGHFMIATRMRDTAFKNNLKNLPPGTLLEVEGPFGSFFLHENAKRPAVFLSGGIGVTPFRSMIVEATHQNLPHKIILLDSNRREIDAPFLKELSELATKNKNFTFVPISSDRDGHIDEAKLKKHVSFDASPIFYIAGPLPMVTAMRTLLNGVGVSNDDIRSEEFAGY